MAGQRLAFPDDGVCSCDHAGELREVDMRVVIVTGIYPPDIGGPASHATDLRDSLIDRGHRVTVLTLTDREAIAREPGVVRWPRSWPWARRHAAVARWIVRNRDRIDAVYATGMHPAAVAGARLASVPVVVKVVGDPAWERARRHGSTDADFETFQGSRRHAPRTRAMLALRNATLRRATAIVTPSDFLAKSVESWLDGPADVHIVPNGVARTPSPRSADRSEGLSVIYVGRLIPHKQVEQLIEAVAATDAARLTVIGSGPEAGRLEARAMALSVGDRVIFLGDRPREEVLARIAAADVLALASDYEGLPHVVLEALAVGTPVISPSVGGVPEVVVDHRNGLLVSDATAQSLAQAMAKLSEDDALRSRLAEGARLDGAAWRFDATADRIEALLEGVRAPRPRLVVVGKSCLDLGSSELRAKLRRMLRHADVSLVQTGRISLTRVGRARAVVFPELPSRAVSGAMFYSLAPLIAVALASGRTRSAVVCRSPYEGVLATAFASVVPKSFRPSVVVEVHGDWRTATRLYGSRARSMMTPIADRLASRAIRRADRVRVVGEYTEALVRQTGYGGPISRHAAFRDFAPFLEASPAPAAGDRLVAFLGGTQPVKGADVLLRAWPSVMSAVPGARLIVAGPGVGFADDDEAGISRVGALDPAGVRDLLDRACVVVMPSRSEGMGRVALEAHGRGRPVVASAVGGLPEVVEDGVTGLLVPAEDPAALAQAVSSLLLDAPRASAMGTEGRRRAEARSPSDEFERGIERLAAWVSR